MSSFAAVGSRSPSPLTPEVSDSLDPVAIHSDLDLNSPWYNPAKAQHPWEMDASMLVSQKMEEDQMLRLDDLLEQHAYEDSPSPESSSSLGFSSPQLPHTSESSIQSQPELAVPEYTQSNLLVPTSLNGSISLTKPIPPPASLPRKPDASIMNQRVVYPSKESCYNLPILFPSIPEGGTKSRVETQVRVTVDLADASSSSDPFKYDRVGSWKWLKLPPGTATKKRTRKQGKIDPDLQDILHLSATVTCASPPHNRVLSCSSCQTREAKRVAKKLAARVRPARSDSESCDGDPTKKSLKSKQHEDTTSIIQFNCAEVLDFSTGSAVLPLRITCYCRHHREKVGFNVHLTMIDYMGRIVGSGTTQPIMITDDHKTATSNGSRHSELNSITPLEPDWSQVGFSNDALTSESRTFVKRKKDGTVSSLKKRPKPYDSFAKPHRPSREGSVSSLPSPSTSYSPLPMTRSPTPSYVLQQLLNADTVMSQVHVQHSQQTPEASSPDILATSTEHDVDVRMSNVLSLPEASDSSSIPIPMNSSSSLMPPQPHPLPYLFFDPTQAQSLPIQRPTIHRLIPNVGPTFGGIEVTVLGANFHPSLQLNCIFGDVAASSTQRWSDNTLVCMLPPRATAGVVAVWFEGFPKIDDQLNSPPSLFTYSDESDRALMELALQVVGLKMTGKIEDAKNVAMRIVGNAGNEGSQSQGGNSNMMQLASSTTSTRDIRPLLFRQAGESENFEDLIVDFLAVIDTPLDDAAPNGISTSEAISHPSTSGQTLLHLSALLGFTSLVKFLIKHGADIDARDNNGYTALHFSALSRSSECARALVEAGADRDIVNVLGKTAEEIATNSFFRDILPTLSDIDSNDENWEADDEEADWGDVEEDDDNLFVRRKVVKRISHYTLRRGFTLSGRGTPRRSADVSRAGTPPPPSPPPPMVEKIEKLEEKSKKSHIDVEAKQNAWFMEMIQRTLAQLPAPQGIIPNIPQFPLPNFPALPDLPAVPWGALPQIPMVFPVFVPMMNGWQAFLSGENKNEGDEAIRGMGAGAFRTAQEWRATWEKWVALAIATTARQHQGDDLPPPMYTPRAVDGESIHALDGKLEGLEPVAGPSCVQHASPEIRPVGYGSPVPDKEVDAFTYRSSKKRTRKMQKQDRMLLLFWLPILFLSMLWAFHNGLRFAFQTVKTALPMRTPIRT